MKSTLVIPYFNSLSQTKICWLLNLNSFFFTGFNEIIFIDNGDTDGTTEWIKKHIITNHSVGWDGQEKFIINKENIGILASLQQGYKNASEESDYIVFMHNDVVVPHNMMHNELDHYFDKDNNVDFNAGVVGLFGAKQLQTDGGRFDCFYSGLEKNEEGKSLDLHEYEEVLILDGLFLAVRKKLLDDIGGWDMNYSYHHFYDKDISMESNKNGYKNYVTWIPYYHLNGQTANQGAYQNWINEKLPGGDQASFVNSRNYFLFKWKGYLGKSV
jgi:GT2 family glycosyltransferase